MMTASSIDFFLLKNEKSSHKPSDQNSRCKAFCGKLNIATSVWLFMTFGVIYKISTAFITSARNFTNNSTNNLCKQQTFLQLSIVNDSASSGVRRKFSWGGFQSAKIFLCTKIESMIRKNIKQAAIQYVNVVKQL